MENAGRSVPFRARCAFVHESAGSHSDAGFKKIRSIFVDSERSIALPATDLKQWILPAGSKWSG